MSSIKRTFTSTALTIGIALSGIAFTSTAVACDGCTAVPLKDMDLNRQAKKLKAKPTKTLFKSANYAFRWNKGDMATKKWRPQGITTINDEEYVLVSWYGRKGKQNLKKFNYSNRGARISFVHKDSLKYRHVLLVDQNFEAYGHPTNNKKTMHAGGIHFMDDILYVADSRGDKKSIRAFPMSNLLEVPKKERKKFHKHAYLLQEDPTKSYLTKDSGTGITPSFLSYDWSTNQYLTGNFTFNRKGPGTLHWYTGNYDVADGATNVMRTPNNFFPSVQGAASDNGKVWLSQSYCKLSKLLKGVKGVADMMPKWTKLDKKAAGAGDCVNSTIRYGAHTPGEAADTKSFKKIVYPVPGLEDLHISEKSKNLWTLTEFNDLRFVFSTAIGKFK